MEEKSEQLIPRWLGYLGLLPFVVPTIFLFFDFHHLYMWRHFLIAYGAVILSFVGALQWAFAMLMNLSAKMRRWTFVWSVMPALAAWVALSVSQWLACIILPIGFGCALLIDQRLARSAVLPSWYLPLRYQLTIVAMSCLIVAGLLIRFNGFFYLMIN